jgi:arabinoxylan arabinofuranohydrolase
MIPIAVIAYMTSKNPLGPFEYQGYTLENPGTYFGAWGNNHHWIFNFRGKYYIAYHAQIIEKTIGFTKGGYRNLMITDFKVNDDGSWPIQAAKKTGVAQSGTFNPYEEIPAATMCYSRNMIVSSQQTLYALKDGAYVCIKGVDFAKGGAKVVVKVASGHKGGTVEFRADHFANGDVLAKLDVKAGEEAVTADFTAPADNQPHDLYITISGDVEVQTWKIQ